ncbi:carbohydrate ABC transporter permease [Streptomyces sp. HNM0663]|uniref:Carbohydrate ABC transporter permease n=1 Tax=Streptomyces chengmaiensis TaxID=3040919 RepID=A0ABT6I0P7_9ACTN|nr:carbohydrate ABC transporter permease [Streptomyces chengmaiensis]MDH2394029.1 carbohydrate ABC transporter permease [Streptomyces chengmaiensis]
MTATTRASATGQQQTASRLPNQLLRRLRPASLGAAAVRTLCAGNILLLLWMVITSLRSTKEIFVDPVGLPTHPRWENYTEAWKTGGFGPALFNSVLAAVGSAIISVAIAAPAAYALSRTKRKAGGPLTLLFALGLGVPAQLIIIPVYVTLAKTQAATHLQLLDSMQGLLFVYVGLAMPFTVFLLTGYFRTLPLEVEEAACMDGAGALRTFVQVVLPMARNGIITALILQVLGAWNETLFALVLLTDTANRTLPVALLSFINQQQFSGTDWGGMFAGVVIIMVPVLVLFVVLGQRLIAGMTAGVSK